MKTIRDLAHEHINTIIASILLVMTIGLIIVGIGIFVGLVQWVAALTLVALQEFTR